MSITDEERLELERLTLALVETCVRNTSLEDLHAGRFPRSATGDWSDVTVMTPEGTIPWTEVSRISDAEMKALMIEVVDLLYTYLTYPEAQAGVRTATAAWDRPKLDANMMKRVRRLQEGRGIGDPEPDPT